MAACPQIDKKNDNFFPDEHHYAMAFHWVLYKKIYELKKSDIKKLTGGDAFYVRSGRLEKVSNIPS